VFVSISNFGFIRPAFGASISIIVVVSIISKNHFFHLFILQQTTLRDPIHAVAFAGILS